MTTSPIIKTEVTVLIKTIKDTGKTSLTWGYGAHYRT